LNYICRCAQSLRNRQPEIVLRALCVGDCAWPLGGREFLLPLPLGTQG
jgi:hypothetical protein